MLLTPRRKLGIPPPLLMLTFSAFTVLSATLLGCVWWVSRDDQGVS